MNDLPRVEKSIAAVLAGVGYVDVIFIEAGTITFPVNTAAATCQVLGGNNAARITPSGPTGFGHVDVQLITASGEVGRGQVAFLVPVSFS